MVGVRTFLEASTIHGLNYISTTKKYARIFWVLVVVAGFSTAGYMIQTSFKDWAANPIRTTLETMPISEIKFPKVTVCPPENTYTDLNYALMVAENATLTTEIQDKLILYTEQVIVEHVYMDDFEIIQDDDRFYNWYHGYSDIFRPFTDKSGFTYVLKTSATSGSVNTQYFGEQYQSHLVKMNMNYGVNVYPPLSVRNNPNVTLHFKLEKVSMTGMSVGWDNVVVEGDNLDAGLSSVTYDFNPPAKDGEDKRWIALIRKNITQEDLKTMDIESMPGFKLSWYYTGLDHETPSNLAVKREAQLFNMFVNLVQSLDSETVWTFVKYARILGSRGHYSEAEWLNKCQDELSNLHHDPVDICRRLYLQRYIESNCTYLLSNENMEKNIKVLMQLSGISTSYQKKNLTKDVINSSAKLFLFLNSCPNTPKQDKLNVYFKQVFKKSLFEPTKSGMILYTLKAIKEQSSDDRIIASKILEKVASDLKLPYAPSQKGFFNTDAFSSFNYLLESMGKSCLKIIHCCSLMTFF